MPASLKPDGKDLSINISFAKNGVTVRASCWYDKKDKEGRDHRSEEYVYNSLDEALEEIPSIVSVFKDKKRAKNSKQAAIRGEDYDEEERR